MSNRIRLCQGLEADRKQVIFSNGEPVFCTDSLKAYVGDGKTVGGRPIRGVDIPYPRAAFSHRFNEFVETSTVFEGLDKVFQFMSSTAYNIYYGDVSSNVLPTTPEDISRFFSGLGIIQDGPVGPKDLTYSSNYTYRVIAYPRSFGQLSRVEDPNLNYLDITNSYDTTYPKIVSYLGSDFYVYFTSDQCLNLNGTTKVIRYFVDYVANPTLQGGLPQNVANPTLTIHQVGHNFVVGQWLFRSSGYYSLASAATEATCEVVGVITRVLDADNFIITLSGYITCLENLLDGYTYFLSATLPGSLATAPPDLEGSVNKPVFLADSPTSGFIINYRGVIS
jgi:hypothetical protein